MKLVPLFMIIISICWISHFSVSPKSLKDSGNNKTCKENESWQEESKCEEPTCLNLKPNCSEKPKIVKRCWCKPNYVRNSLKICVLEKNCGKILLKTITLHNHTLNINNTMKGVWYNQVNLDLNLYDPSIYCKNSGGWQINAVGDNFVIKIVLLVANYSLYHLWMNNVNN